ncbi:MAG TPA: alanine racemase [Gemmatimonadales bacterium]|nr:alanine racemase [Gemmatimonadales bacterium]
MTESNPAETRRAWIDVDLAALVANARQVQDRAGVPLLPMVKANGYGLGAMPVVRALEPLDPWGFGVATTDEARTLRDHGVGRPILVLSPLASWMARDCLAAEARPAIGDLAALEAWLALGKAPFHLEVDSGMSRAGFRPDDHDTIASLRELLADAPGWEGIFTHFHSADSDPATAAPQWDRLQGFIATLGRRPRFVHAASSSGVFAGKQYGGDFARPGIFLYGGRVGDWIPRPVARFQARVIATRRLQPGDTASYGATWTAPKATTLATLGAGYADGILRSLSNRGRVQIGEGIHRIAGRVTMDMTVVDVGEASVAVGDVATIWGGDVTLSEQAEHAATNPYELLTALGSRVIRRYSDE